MMAVSRLPIRLLLATSVLTNAISTQKAPTPLQPHILMIIMDDLGSQDLGLHGTGIQTPTCDDLARSGAYLDNYYVLPCCSPTRASLLSGRYPLHHGLHEVIEHTSTKGLPLDEETLPQMLNRAGYQSHAVGKWHVGHSKWKQTPTYRGFHSFFGYLMGSQDYYTHKTVIGQGYDLRYDREPNCGPGCSQIVDERGNYSTHVYTREAIRVINDYDESKGPLFLYLAFQAVHWPDEVPPEYKERYSRKNWTDIRKTYAGMLSSADEAIARVLDALKAQNMYENTLIIFTTDNGGPTTSCAVQGSSNGQRRGGKCSLWEGGTTGDGFVSGPALTGLGIPRGVRVPHIFHVVDWLPTLAGMVGAKPEGKKLDGVNQLEALRGIGPAREELYVGYARLGASFGDWYGPSIRCENWKLVQGISGGPDDTDVNPRGTAKPASGGIVNTTYLLYDLTVDKGEQENLANVYPDVLEMLRLKLAHYDKSFVAPESEDPSCPFHGLVNTTVGPTWLPWCSGASELVVYS